MSDVVLAPGAAAELKPAGESGRLADHLHRVGEENLGLVAGGTGRVDLGAVFTVGVETEQADAAHHRALTVALSHFDERPTKAPNQAVVAVLDLPAEQRAEDEDLGGFQQEGAAVELPFAQLQDGFEISKNVGRCFNVPNQAACGAARDVVEVTTAGVADVGAGDDLAAQDRVGVSGRAVNR